MSKDISSKVRTGGKAPRGAPTRKVHWLRDQLPNPEDQREYARERCVVAITEAVGEAMERAGLSRADVARELGVSRSYITKLLSGGHNMTLHSLGDLLWACNQEVLDLELNELGVVEVLLDPEGEWIGESASVVLPTSSEAAS